MQTHLMPSIPAPSLAPIQFVSGQLVCLVPDPTGCRDGGEGELYEVKESLTAASVIGTVAELSFDSCSQIVLPFRPTVYLPLMTGTFAMSKAIIQVFMNTHDKRGGCLFILMIEEGADYSYSW